MGARGCWEGTYYRVENPMKYEYPLYYAPDEYSHVYTGMFGDWTGYEGKWAFGWDFLQKTFTGGWVTVNPGAFRKFEQVPWNEIPRRKVDSNLLSQYGPDYAMHPDRLSNTETYDFWTKGFSGGFKYNNYCTKPISGWPMVEASKHVKPTGKWEDPTGGLHDEQGKTFNRQYTNLSQVNHPTNTPIAIHMEKNPDVNRVPNVEDLRNAGYYTDVYVALVGQELDNNNKISEMEYYASRPDNGTLALDAGEKCYEYAREDSDGTRYWIIDNYAPSQFSDYDTSTQISDSYNTYKGFKDDNTPGSLVQSGPNVEPMWDTENWTQLTDTTVAQRRQDWIDDNCTGDDWASPRPNCNINCDGAVKFQSVKNTA